MAVRPPPRASPSMRDIGGYTTPSHPMIPAVARTGAPRAPEAA